MSMHVGRMAQLFRYEPSFLLIVVGAFHNSDSPWSLYLRYNLSTFRIKITQFYNLQQAILALPIRCRLLCCLRSCPLAVLVSGRL